MSLLGPRPIDASFLPEDYLERRAEARTNLISIALFVVVTLGVIGAFFVTSRQWNDVKSYQQAVNVRYTQAAKDIEQLKQLEKQKTDLLEKAEVTTALIERVPRSILLAELVNRMPSKMTLLSIEVASARLDKPVRQYGAPPPASKDGGKSLSGKAANDKKKADKPVVTAPRFDHKIILIGVSRTHNEVARYVSNLQECAMLTGVDLIFSEQTKIESQTMNRFRVEAVLRPEADARKITPMAAPRLQTVDEMTEPTEGGTEGTKRKGGTELPLGLGKVPSNEDLEAWRNDPTVPRPEPEKPVKPDEGADGGSENEGGTKP
ncbi:MAG: PilN domain-containing protein [Phycisphaerales bacterium]